MIKNILKKKPYIIAEIGANHNGNISLAKKTILYAKKAGCDAVKFQSWDETLNSNFVYEKNRELLKQMKKFKVSFNDLKKLRNYSKKIGIDFGTAIFNKRQLIEAVKIKCDFIKIASMDIDNSYLLELVADIKSNLIISTGTASKSEIIYASNIFKRKKKKNVIFLHCISLYPPRNEKDINLKNILLLKKITGFETGFSDHTTWLETNLAATAIGAKVIEKHFTTNKKLKGWDHSISADLDEMKSIVSSCKKISLLLGNEKRTITKNERDQAKVMRRSICAIEDIKNNEKFTLKNIDLRRPGYGISPKKFKDFLKMKNLGKFIPKGSLIKKDKNKY